MTNPSVSTQPQGGPTPIPKSTTTFAAAGAHPSQREFTDFQVPTGPPPSRSARPGVSATKSSSSGIAATQPGGPSSSSSSSFSPSGQGSGAPGINLSRPSIYPISPTVGPGMTHLGTPGAGMSYLGTPPSLSMSFGMAGMSFSRPSMLEGHLQSQMGGTGTGASASASASGSGPQGLGVMLGSSQKGAPGFAGFAGYPGSFNMGSVRDDPMLDPFLSSPGAELGYSFTGRNGSYRSSPMNMPRNISGYGGGSFVGSLNAGGSSWTKLRNGWGNKEAEFCKDFHCCGKDLGNLHDLLDHYEEAHVVVLRSPGSPHGMDLSMEIDDVEMESIDEASPESSSASASAGTSSTNVSPVPGHALPGLLPTTSSGKAMSSAMKSLLLDDILENPSTSPSSGGSKPDSAFDSYVVASPPKIFTGPSSTLPGGRKASLTLSRRAFAGANLLDPATKQKNRYASAFVSSNNGGEGDDEDHDRQHVAVAPNVLFSNQQAIAEGAEGSADEGESNTNNLPPPAAAAAPAPNSKAAAANDTQPSLFATHRPYRCPQPGCQKAYKQSNGLKYHLLKGQCNFEVRDAMEFGGLTLEEAEELAKPYLCAAGQGCKKRYRQMNGLKYHYMNSGAHGEIGLMLLAQGKHPNPPNVPTPDSKKTREAAAAQKQAAANASNNIRPGNWMRNAVKASGKEMGLPLNSADDRGGEEAMLFSGSGGFDL